MNEKTKEQIKIIEGRLDSLFTEFMQLKQEIGDIKQLILLQNR